MKNLKTLVAGVVVATASMGSGAMAADITTPAQALNLVDTSAFFGDAFDVDQAGDTFVTPRNTLEESIAEVWREVLKLERIGVHDNFFDLGGHSLNATQVVSRLRNRFRSEIPLRHMFDFPTIAELAEDVARTPQGGIK